MKDTIKLGAPVRMIAHRGVCGLERENTCAAFVAAGNRSYYGVETDVHRTADGKFIIIHDDNISRLYCSVRSERSHRNSYIRYSKDRRIVYTVSYKRQASLG